MWELQIYPSLSKLAWISSMASFDLFVEDNFAFAN